VPAFDGIGTMDPGTQKGIAPTWTHCSAPGRLPFVGQRRDEGIEDLARVIEGSGWKLVTPPLFEISHGPPRGVQDGPAVCCRKDQLCPTIGRIGLAFDVAETLEFVDEFRAGRQAQLGLCGEVGQSNAIDSDVLPNLEVRKPDIAKSPIHRCAVEELRPESEEESTKYLTNSKPVIREAS
jgi:hypothetical protein